MTQQLDRRIYQRAEQLLSHNRSKLVTGSTVAPQWLDGGARFWFRDHAGEFMLVDPVAKTREPAVDHARLASTLDDQQPTSFLDVVSPDKKWAVSRRGHDLVGRSLVTGEERQLTFDGNADRPYGTQPDCLTFGQLMRKFGAPHLPAVVSWSPDSRRIVSHRLDQRDVPMAHLVEAAPTDGGRPVLHSYHYAMPGDDVLPRSELVVFDVESGTVVPSKGEPLLTPLLSPILWHRLWWSPDGSAVYYLDQPRDLRTLQLNRLDPLTGEVTTLLEESDSPRIEPGQVMGQTIVRTLSHGREVVWWSQRDGWGHLYLYDLTSQSLVGQLTSGEFLVQEILHVDEAARVVYFVASGLVPANPYRRQVCRVGLDGTGFARVTDDDLDHAVTVPPSGAYFVDSASTTSLPPVITARAWTGDVLVELARADITKLAAIGWRPPEEFRATAADGTTDIYGVIYFPPDFDSANRYPVVDSPYPGPQHGRIQPYFGGTPHFDMDAEAVAALGFVVIAVDGRGTPGRSRHFHDLSYGNLQKAGMLEDHIAAFRQLAETRPWMDLDRVGIYGYSGGGFATVRALCTFPDFYRVGVSVCGNHEQRIYHQSWAETYDGPLDDELYRGSSNVEIADRLVGKLLLIHGEMDDNVHPHHTMRLVDRLIAANKDFDLLIVPGAEHTFVGHHEYVLRRRWDFLVRHLLGVEPPAGYRLAEIPADPSVLSSIG